jgi:hypothetical protein
MVEIYVRGAKPGTILNEVACGDIEQQGAVVLVPKALSTVLARRLGELPDEPLDNDQLFWFLFNRIDDSFLEQILRENPSLLERKTYVWRTLMRNRKIRVHARAHRYGCLPENLRIETTDRLRESLFEGDGAFIDDEDVFNLFSPEEQDQLLAEIRNELSPTFSILVNNVASLVNEDEDPSDAFQDLRATLDAIEKVMGGDATVVSSIEQTRYEISSTIRELEGRMSPPQNDDDDTSEPPSPSKSNSGRSIFDDIDQ